MSSLFALWSTPILELLRINRNDPYCMAYRLMISTLLSVDASSMMITSVAGNDCVKIASRAQRAANVRGCSC